MEVSLLQQQNRVLLEQLRLQQTHCRSLMSSIAGSWVALQPENTTLEIQSPVVVRPTLPQKSDNPKQGQSSSKPSKSDDNLGGTSRVQYPLPTEFAQSVIQDSVLISSFDKSRVPTSSPGVSTIGKYNKYRNVPCLNNDEVNAILKNKYGESREHISNPVNAYNYFDSSSIKFADQMSEGTSADETLTSTPRRHHRSETPKSILKRRQLIDNHVRVDSEFNHTPLPTVTPKKRGLNFSYSDVNDVDFAKENMLESMERMSMDEDLNGSYMEEASLRTISSQQSSEFPNTDARVPDRLLRDIGNDRKNATVARHLSLRPKSVVFDPDAPTDKVPISSVKNGRTAVTTSANTTKSGVVGTKSSLLSRDPEGPLLGYDWIAGVLDNEGLSMDLPDEFFEELREFRRQNKDDCASSSNPYQSALDLTKPIQPEVNDPGHTCIHGFTINDRLFPEAMNPDEEGRSVCPVCLSTRNNPCPEEPGFVRVSIPRSTLESPYRVKPHRRKSFDSSDTFALANHCLAGWETSKPSMIPAASSIDLKEAADGISGKLSTTVRDADRLAKSFCRQMKNTRTTEDLISLADASRRSDTFQGRGKLSSLPSARIAPSARFSLAESILDVTADTARSIPKSSVSSRNRTEELLNTTHALKMEQQRRRDEEHLMEISRRSHDNSRRGIAAHQ